MFNRAKNIFLGISVEIVFTLLVITFGYLLGSVIYLIR